MQVGEFYQQLHERIGGCCRKGHSLAKTREVIVEYNTRQNSDRLNFDRLKVFFVLGQGIRCDCQVLRDFNPFQNSQVRENWNNAFLGGRAKIVNEAPWQISIKPVPVRIDSSLK